MCYWWRDPTSCGRFSRLQWWWWYWRLCRLAFSWVSSSSFGMNQRLYFTSSLKEFWAWLKTLMESWLFVLGFRRTGNIQHSHSPGVFLALLMMLSLAGKSASCTWTLGLSPCRLVMVTSYLTTGWGLRGPESDTSLKWCYKLNIPFSLELLFLNLYLQNPLSITVLLMRCSDKGYGGCSCLSQLQLNHWIF